MFLIQHFMHMFCVLFCTLSIFDEGIAENETCEIQVLYEEGVEAYLEDNFKKCIQKFENSIEMYNSYMKKLQNCRIRCAEEASNADFLYPLDVSDLRFFEKTLRNTLCLVKCKQNDPELRKFTGVPKETEQFFEDRKPYEYLHLCYFQEKQHQKAASAVFTFLVSNPDDEAARKSLKYYSTFPDVDMQELINHEAKEYVYLYVHGSHAYEHKDWDAVINYMEESLSSYLQSEEECRAQCEGPFDHRGWYPDFIPAIANHFTYALKCKRRCRNKLNSLNGEKHGDLLPSHYHYLQFAYFKNKDYKASCEAVASYLLFYPDDETMRANVQYYAKLPDVEDYYFTPRPEAAFYIQRQHYEEKLNKFIDEEFSPSKLAPKISKKS